MPNVNVTYEEMRNAGKQLQAGQQDIETRLSQLKSQVDQLVAGGYVTDVSSRQFQSSYEEFNTGSTSTPPRTPSSRPISSSPSSSAASSRHGTGRWPT